MKAICGIYKITSKINGKIYVGSAINFYQRMSVHLHRLKNNIHENKKLQNHANKYGINDLLFSVLELVLFREHLIEREQFYFKILEPEFNILKIAGSLQGYKFSDESRQKMSKTHSSRVRPQISDLGKENMRIAHLGKKLSHETIRKRTEKQRGQKRSKKFCENLGRIHSKSVIDAQNNVIYESAKIAALHIGMSPGTLRSMLNGYNPNKTNLKYIITYK